MKDTENIRRGLLFLGAILVGIKGFDLTLPLSDNAKWNFNLLGFAILAIGLIWDFANNYQSPIKRVSLIIEPVFNVVSSILGAATGSEIRIGLFLLEKNFFRFRGPDKVRIYFHSSNMEGAPDLALTFEKRQGLVGHIWDDRRAASADLTLVQGQNAFWNMNPTQIALTSSLRAIYGSPIIDSTDDNKLIGILVFDTTAVYLHANPRKGKISNYFSSNTYFQETVTVLKECILKVLKYFNLIRVLD